MKFNMYIIYRFDFGKSTQKKLLRFNHLNPVEPTQTNKYSDIVNNIIILILSIYINKPNSMA